MYARDRMANLGLFALAVVAWVMTAFFIATRSPRGDVAVQLVGAVLLGFSVGVTTVPLFWLTVFAVHRRIAYRGDWMRAARRGAWLGVLVAFFVVLRGQDAFSLPIALFVVAMVAVVELTLSIER
ncbi:MAG: hypothetical protein M3301_02510 [Chloroflexota bacterium]|nr:hypothetical protein [Chloroflexota bacterium]